MTNVATERDPMSAEVQIRCAIEEGMKNIMCAIFGENLATTVSFTLLDSKGVGLDKAVSTATAELYGRAVSVKADVPIRWPDAESCICRVADVPFVVEADNWTKTCQFEAWCENNPYNGAKVIVRQVYPNADWEEGCSARERWLVADSMEGEVICRLPWENLPRWAKEVVAEKWSHLPHVCLDTETVAMAGFIRRQG